MSLLFDSSALFAAMKKAEVEVVLGHHTLSLARYELGNVIWRERILLGKIPTEEAEELAQQLRRILHNMEILDIVDEEPEILKLASNSLLSFYDSSYVHTSKKLGLTLVTQDKKLAEKARSVGVATISMQAVADDVGAKE